MKKLIICFVIALFVQISFGQDSNLTQFFFIRHAEKVKNGEKDPALTKIGEKRAVFWSEVFKNIEFEAIYSTQTKRTLSTAQPTAKQKKLAPIIYHTKTIDLKKIAEKYKGKKILIVGHSNTIPDMVNYLLGNQGVGEIGEFNNSNLYIVNYAPSYSDLTLLYVPLN